MAKLDPVNKVPVLCVHGDVCSYTLQPLSSWPAGPGGRQQGWLWPQTSLCMAVLLGRDLYDVSTEMEGQTPSPGLMVVTRSQLSAEQRRNERRQ